MGHGELSGRVIGESLTVERFPLGPESSPGEFHPKALAEPYVNVSIHTAPIIQPGEVHQATNVQSARAGAKRPARASVWHA